MSGKKHIFSKFLILLGENTLEIIEDIVFLTGFAGEIFASVIDLILHPKKFRWKECLYYMELCGADAVPIVSIICFLMGLILGFQAAEQLHKFGTDIFVADLVGLSISMELGPLMVAMISTGRAGSAFAAEIGTMKVSEEIDAMTTMGFIPVKFLVIPKLIAMIIVIPLLTVLGDLMGVIGGMVVAKVQLDIPIITYYSRTIKAIGVVYFCEGLIKSFVFSILIACIGCMRGFQAKSDAQGVGRAATSAVVTSIFVIVVADMILTMLFSLLKHNVF